MEYGSVKINHITLYNIFNKISRLFRTMVIHSFSIIPGQFHTLLKKKDSCREINLGPVPHETQFHPEIVKKKKVFSYQAKKKSYIGVGAVGEPPGVYFFFQQN
jgi:hypothetical protein